MRNFDFMNESYVVDSSLRTVEWKNNKVRMIEQTKLPNELEFVEYDDFNQVANAIKTLIVRGAPAIGVSGAFGLGLAVLQSKATTRDELLSDLEIAKKIKQKYGFAKLMTATNVFAHINNFSELIKSLKLISNKKSIIVIENHYLKSILQKKQIETFFLIYS